MATWLITGAGRGIGLEMARQLKARGDEVIGTVRDEAKSGALTDVGARVELVDVAEPAAIDALGERMRGQAIDVLVNNAGIGRFGGAVKDLTAEEMHRYMAVNAIGPILVVRALLASLRAGGAKKIASITSLMGSIADNGSGGAYGYRSSKAALNMLNASLSLELKREGFTCLVLNPGWVQTDMGGARAQLTPAESVAGILRVVAALTPAQAGGFYDWNGAPHPW